MFENVKEFFKEVDGKVVFASCLGNLLFALAIFVCGLIAIVIKQPWVWAGCFVLAIGLVIWMYYSGGDEG